MMNDNTNDEHKPKPAPHPVSPGGPSATPDTPEGREAADAEGEEA